MKKQYTKKQITEAIKHWKGVLRKMNESSEEIDDGTVEIDETCILVKYSAINEPEIFSATYFGPVDSVAQAIYNSIQRLYEDTLTLSNIKIDEGFILGEMKSKCRELRKFLIDQSKAVSDKEFIMKIEYKDSFLLEGEYTVLCTTKRMEETIVCLPHLMNK